MVGHLHGQHHEELENIFPHAGSRDDIGDTAGSMKKIRKKIEILATQLNENHTHDETANGQENDGKRGRTTPAIN